MGEIFLARVLGPRGFERPVAMKRILPHLSEDPGTLHMFATEARIAARILHARVVQVHELVEIEGAYFLVMEYVEGESVGALMRCLWLRGELLDRVLGAHIVAEACAGLHAAHELIDARGMFLGIVHCDISPQNVMITYAGEVKVLDFGIAKAHDMERTKSAGVRGKCEYMSPEQCRGEILDRQSDIFSLGILLYELTVGRRLFKRDSALRAFAAICDEEIPRPTEVDREYPQILAQICARALARDRGERYATALEMRRDLTTAIRSMPGAKDRAGEEEILADLMRELFSDSLRDKRELLRGAALGAAVEQIAVAEAAQVPPSRPASVSRHRRFSIGAMTVVALAVGAALWARPSASFRPCPCMPGTTIANYVASGYGSFRCWNAGMSHDPGMIWYYSRADHNDREGWVRGDRVNARSAFEPNPAAFGFMRCDTR